MALAVDYDDEPIIVSVTMGTGQSQPAVMVKLEDKPDEICVPCLYGLVSLSVSSDIYIYIYHNKYTYYIYKYIYVNNINILQLCIYIYVLHIYIYDICIHKGYSI